MPAPRKKSLVLLNTGDGKGKTSAAIGVMCRGWARGWKVTVVQFIKGGKWKTGEHKVAEQLGVDWHELGDGFTWESDDLDETAAKAQAAWVAAKDRIGSGDYDLVICDEITYSVTFGWVPVDDIVATIQQRPDHVNVVLTGRDAAPELVDLADTATEMRKLKHVYDQGVQAKKGIEY